MLCANGFEVFNAKFFRITTRYDVVYVTPVMCRVRCRRRDYALNDPHDRRQPTNRVFAVRPFLVEQAVRTSSANANDTKIMSMATISGFMANLVEDVEDMTVLNHDLTPGRQCTDSAFIDLVVDKIEA